MFSIYKITNKINGKLYIGYSKRPAARWYDHKKFAQKHKKGVLYNAIRKHGVENFVLEIIYQSLDEHHTRNVMEDFFISKYNTRTPFGYNNAPGGQGGAIRSGLKHTDDTKRKISLSRLNKPSSDETKRKISASLMGSNNPMFGKKHSTKTKQVLSLAAKKRIYNPNCRKYVKGVENPTSKKY
jgi:group I intron endonuclease